MSVTVKQLLARAPAPRTTAPRLVQMPARAFALAADDAGDGPATVWLQVLRVGKFWSPRYKDFSVTKATLSTMVENFKTVTPKAPTELPLDYNHGTNRPDTVEQGKAAGWIKDVELRGEGTELWAQVELTPEAADLVRNKEYRYISASFDFEYVHTQDDKRKKDIGPTLMAAALTNTPFVEGMQPVSLSGSIALTDDEGAEALFSFSEIRRRVENTLRDKAGVSESSCCGPYVVDLFDGYLIYRRDYNSETFRLDYSLGADGSVTFTGNPIEVRMAYPPLAAGATDMAKITVKDAAGHDIELTEEQVTALVKAHAPKPATGSVDLARLDALEVSLTKAQTEITELSATNLALQNEKKEMAAKAKVDALIRAGKIAPKQREEWTKLALADRDTFKTLTDGLPVLFKANDARGSAEDAESTSATDEVNALAQAEQEKNGKLSLADAQSRVFQKNPALYDKYKNETAVKV